MADYQLTASETITRNSDKASIPPDPLNNDYAAYLKWVEAGGVPDPYVAPEPVPAVPTPVQQVMLDHENRLRSIEGTPPLTMEDFVTKMAAPVKTEPKAKPEPKSKAKK